MLRQFKYLYFIISLVLLSGVLAEALGGFSETGISAAPSAFSSGQSNRALLVINILMATTTAVLAIPRIYSIGALSNRLKVLTLLSLWAVISVIWSDERATTFRLSVYLLIYLMAAFIAGRELSCEEIVESLCFTTVLLVLVSVPAQYIFKGSLSIDDGWTGPFQQKNGLGLAMAVGVAAFFHRDRRWPLRKVVGMGACLILLLFSRSTTSLFACIGGLLAIGSVRVRKSTYVLALWVILATLILAGLVLPNYTQAFTDVTGKDTTLTGRTALWGLVFEQILKHPLLGYGYQAFWSTNSEAIDPFVHWHPGQAHNGYLELSLDLGAIGLALLLLTVLESIRRARRAMRRGDKEAGSWLLAVVILLCVHSFAESDFLQNSFIWFLFLATNASLAWTQIHQDAAAAVGWEEEFNPQEAL